MFSENIKAKFPFSAFTLKMVALITMVIDHVGLFAYGYGVIDASTADILRQIGRISFILFAFTVAESYLHTRSKEKYLLRLFTFGLVVQGGYLLGAAIIPGVVYQDAINIFITLFLGAFTCYLFELKGYKKLLFLLPLLFVLFSPWYIEYGFYGVGLVFVFYLLQNNALWKSIALVIWNFLILMLLPIIWGWLVTQFPFIPSNGLFPLEMTNYQYLSVLAIPFIILYNGKRGYSSTFMKYFFYVFYPLHLILLEVLFGYMYEINWFFSSLGDSGLWQSFLAYIGILAVVILILLILDKKISKVLKLENIKKNFKYYLIGLGISLMASFVIGLVIYLSGGLEFGLFKQENLIYVVYLLILFAVQSLVEEILLRTFLLDAIRLKTNGALAIIITSVLFGLLHLGNGNISIIPIINIILFGLFAGVITYKQNNIYFASGFHFGWNVIQVILLGVISGVTIDKSLFSVVIKDGILAGGNFGFEGSILTTIVFMTLLVIMINYRVKREGFKWIVEYPLAHRGYFNAENPENTLGAFKRAVERNFAIELDIQLSKDNEVVVFHDFTLNRMCGVDKKVNELTLKELQQLSVGNTAWTIPSFKEFLELVDGKVPLIVEIKNSGMPGILEQKTYEILKDYKGKFVVQSFNSFSMMWYREHAPEFIRGQLSSEHRSGSNSRFTRFLLRYLFLNVFAQVDFINMHIEYDNWRIRMLRKKIYKIGFTARSKEVYESKMGPYDNVIFDSFEFDDDLVAKYFTKR
jgi:glycerophosphoryl diester phosphodiesterase/membrane protease YdiL (CAAX protease family)